MKEIRDAVIQLMDKHPVLTKLKGDDWYSVEDSITNLIHSITGTKDTTYQEEIVYPTQLDKELSHEPSEFEEKIFRKVKRYYQLEDLQTMLSEDAEEDYGTWNEETHQKIKNKASTIINRYDDFLDYDWRTALKEAIDYVVTW